MIQVIGFMIGFYILARCAEMAASHTAGALTKILAATAFLANLLGMLLLLTLGAATTVLPR